MPDAEDAGTLSGGRARSAENFCRDDHIRQAFPAAAPNVGRLSGVGFCSPAYFM